MHVETGVLEMPAYAKINITLDVLGLRSDGYHDVEMIMQSVDLHDIVRVQRRKDDAIVLHSDTPGVPLDERNLMVRAASLLRREAGGESGVDLTLGKRIPIAAGLAGGSADAAATLHLLNRLWSLEWPLSRLMDLGARLGSDVPFCLQGGTALAFGRGERIEAVQSLAGLTVLLVKPPFGVSTPEIYKGFDRLENKPLRQASRRLLERQSQDGLFALFHNDLQEVTAGLYPEVGELIERIAGMGGRGVMTGSGPTVMGLFTDSAEMQRARELFARQYPETYVVRTI